MTKPLTIAFAENDRLLSLLAAILSPDSAGAADNVSRFFRELVPETPKALAAWKAGYAFKRSVESRVAMDDAMLAEMIGDAEILVTETVPVDDKLLAHATRLKLVYMHGADLRLIDVEACRQRGITVRSLARHSTDMVAEHTIMLMLMLVKRLPEQLAAIPIHALTPDGNWSQNWAGLKRLDHLSDCTVGLVGFGEIGQAVARRLRGFGCKLLYTQRTRNKAAEQIHEARYLPLADLLTEADLLSVHVPSNSATHGLVGSAQLRRMRRGSLAVSMARNVLDPVATLEAVRSGQLAGAAFDTFGREPLPVDDPLLQEPRIIVTPHTAAGSIDIPWLDREYRVFMQDLAAVSGEGLE